VADWSLQGSNDGVTWVDLKVHTNDIDSYAHPPFTSLIAIAKLSCGRRLKPSAVCSWPVPLVNFASYRYFRVIVSGPSAEVPHKLCLSGLELYGYLFDVGKPVDIES